MKVTPDSIKTAQLHAYLLGAVSPRPICFASTISEDGEANLSPFSFFNVFGSKPPLLIFSPARRVRDNTTKHTLQNAYATKEVVINVVSYDMVQQMSLASCEYPKGTSEFEKAGFTPLPSDLVQPFRVKESPVQIECRVNQIIETGIEGGAGNLIICEVLCMHINDDILNEAQQIDPHKIDLVARMGGDYYCRASGEAVFTVPKPNLSLGIGIDQLPEHVRHSSVLTGNNLGLLANSTEIPLVSTIESDERIRQIMREFNTDNSSKLHALHLYAKEVLDMGHVDKAWHILLSNNL